MDEEKRLISDFSHSELQTIGTTVACHYFWFPLYFIISLADIFCNETEFVNIAKTMAATVVDMVHIVW